MTEEEMRLFAAAQIAAGYLPPQPNARGDGWLYERDHDRFVGWQIGRLQERERCAAKAAPEHIQYSDDEWRVRCEVRDSILGA